MKYDSAGNVKWAKQAEPHNENSGCVSRCIANDRLGNTFSTGGFGDTVQYGAYILADGFWSYGDFDIVKWDSAGNVLWAKQAKKSSTACDGEGWSITTDKGGNAYACGTFLDTLIFGQDTVKDPVYGRQNFFVVKYDPNGNVLWAKNAAILDSNYGWVAW